MGQNFIACDRDQELLLPPSLREWLSEDHLAWFVLDAVEQLDLSRFYGDYREDGWGRAAHDTRMMVALLIYAYSVGTRSARGIERRCREDVAFRVITANQTPDHATVARFRARHEDAISELFGGVLELCARAGLVQVGIVAVDGTKIAAAATHHATRSYEEIAREILEEAAENDAREDELYGDARGDELPSGFAPRGIGARCSARPSRHSKRSAPRRPSPSPATAASGLTFASGAWSRTGRWSARWWPTTPPGTPAESRRTGRGGWSARGTTSSPTRSRPSRRARSTSPIRTRAI
jgi:transposase